MQRRRVAVAPAPGWVGGEDVGIGGIDSAVLARIEGDHPEGVSSAEILDTLASLGVRFSEATLRKWVQLGLLPRSVRVGRKGKHSGSQGMYPATIVRQILHIKEMLAGDLTIEQIQKEVLFVRGDIEELERSMQRIFRSLDQALAGVDSEPVTFAVAQDVTTAKDLAQQLLGKLTAIEQRLIGRAVVGRSSVATG